MKLIDCRTKKYPNAFAKVDDNDFEFLTAFGKWGAWQSTRDGLPHGPIYAVKTLYVDGDWKSGRTTRMHKLLLDSPIIDHADGDGLNNQRHNLRTATHSQNGQNSRKHKKTASAFKGVTHYRQQPNKQWGARIRIEGKFKFLGLFHSEYEAANAYDIAAISIFGEFANLNFVSGKSSVSAQPNTIPCQP